VGATLSFLGGKGFAAVSVYDLRRDNIAIPDSSGITRQSGDQRSKGVELDLNVQPYRGWGVMGSYAFTDATLTSFSEIVRLQPPDFVVVDRSGNVAPFAPRHLLGLWVSKHFDSGLGLAVGLRHVSEQFTAEDNRATIDPYTTLDAAVSYERKSWGLRVHFRNITDDAAVSYERKSWGLRVHFRNITDTAYETRGFGSASAIPARPFDVRARLQIGFGRR